VAYASSPIVTNGDVTGAVLAFHDTSVHKALDEALRRSEREAATRASQLVAIFESMADAVLVYDREGRILQTNGADAAMFDIPLPPSDLSSSFEARDRLLEYLDETGQPIAEDHRPSKRVLRGELLRGASAVDLFVRPHGGHEVIINVSGAPIRDSDGNIVGGVLIGRDVTHRRWQERQAHEALTALMAMAEALVSSSPDDTEISPLGSLNAVARQLAMLTRAVMGCERVSIVSTDPESGEMRVAAIVSFSPEQERIWRANWPRARAYERLPSPRAHRATHGGQDDHD
jgi:PAS domain-containing protein